MFNTITTEETKSPPEEIGHQPQSGDSISHLALTAAPASQQALADLGPRGLPDSIFFLLVNALIPVWLPVVLHSTFFAILSVFSIFFNFGKLLYLRHWAQEVATNPSRAELRFSVLKCGQNACLACVVGWAFLTFGINPVTSLGTMVLIAFAQAATSVLRPSVRIMRLVLCCCLLPAAVAAVWIGGRAGYGTALILTVELVFLWIQGAREHREYLHSLFQNRKLVRARRQANQNGARISDALFSNAARHTATVAERNRIACEWHDTLLAGFSAISWQLNEAKRRQREDPSSVEETIELARNMVHHCRAEARLIISDLLYQESDAEDLVNLLKTEIPNITTGLFVDLSFEVSGKPSLIPPRLGRELLRISQEAVTNAARHANPSRISILVEFAEKKLTLSISDDGCGFANRRVPAGHFGLQIMKQRAQKLLGELTVNSAPNAGTTVSVTVPYSTDFNMTPTRILIVEDQCLSRLAIHTVIDNQPDMAIVCDADTGRAGLNAFREHSPDVTIMDLKLPDQPGIEVIKAIRRIDPTARIIVLSNFDGSEYLHRATDAGAMAYLTKDSSADELLQAVREVRVGQSFIPASLLHLLENRVAGNDLTGREQGVLRFLVLGWSNKQIGDHLGIAEKTVRIHLSSIFAKLGAVNRTQAVLIALQRGFVDPQTSEKPAGTLLHL